MKVNINQEKINERNQALTNTQKSLKSVFVGIDAVIDELIDAIRVWYLMPEILSRPVIINLWGMTGVGKTDLVRRLVSALKYQDRFMEIELSNNDSTNWYTSVGSVLERNSLNDSEPKILLFDEIQRFNTIDSEGKPVISSKFSDFWELLSDGRLSRRDREDIDYLLSEFIYSSRSRKRRADKEGNNDSDESVAFYEAEKIKQTLELEADLHDVAEMPRSEIIRLLYAAKEDKRVYEPVDHSKTLIIICGNLDDIFSMANLTAESDVDADIFHAFTEKVTTVDVKRSLSQRFRPEQVARFGNIHLLYRSLRRADFERLIAREVQRVIDSAQESLGLTLSVSPEINQLIYRNGVFPVQGVRPVFSTVNDILESNMARFVFEALIQKAESINIYYNSKTKELCARVSDTLTMRHPYTGRLDRIRQQSKVDLVANVSVHEAGHALLYGVLFGLAPLQLTSRSASSLEAGFTFPHDIHNTRQNLIAQIMIYLAGGIAEEIVFGPDHASTGRQSDRERASQYALDFVRKHGFAEKFQTNYTLGGPYEMDKSVTEADVEKMMVRLVAETREVLCQNSALLISLSAELAKIGELDGDTVVKIAARHDLVLRIQPEGYLHLPNYADILSTAVNGKSKRE